MADVCEALGAPGMDLAGDTTSGWLGGELVAYATTRAREQSDPVHRVTLDIALHRAHRAPSTPRALLDWCRGASTRCHQEHYGETLLELTSVPATARPGSPRRWRTRSSRTIGAAFP